MQANSLKIISLNIEMDKHIDAIIPFFLKHQPDVILLQEVMGKNKAYIEAAMQMHGMYVIQNVMCKDDEESSIGLLTLSKYPILNQSVIFYRGQGVQPVKMTHQEPKKMARALAMVEIVKEGQSYCLINTHFTWTPDGLPSQEQHQDLDLLLKHLKSFPEFILCGDFNAPRGQIIFNTLASIYTDNIPTSISTTIDKHLHRCGDLHFVVDGVFTTSSYKVINVQVESGVSDHCAIISTLKIV